MPRTPWLDTLAAFRPHFFIALALFLLLAFMAVSEDRTLRIALIIPALILYHASQFLLVWERNALQRANRAGKRA